VHSRLWAMGYGMRRPCAQLAGELSRARNGTRCTHPLMEQVSQDQPRNLSQFGGGEMDLFVVFPQDPGLCQENRAFLHVWARQKGNEETLTIASPATARTCNRLEKFVPSVGFHDSDMLSSGVSNFSGLTPWYSFPYKQSFAAYCATPSEMRCHGMYGRLTFVTHYR
jgi:hypothetical protein